MKIKGNLGQITSREKVDKFHRTKKNISSFISKRVWAIASPVGWYLINSNPLQAQITSDGTIGTEVNTTDQVTEIVGGETRGGNLFHSFQDFSIETGNTAFFNNATDINNILSRVTGGAISKIDGLIKANGNANLILINPRGINFGRDARLDIGGSFLGSTADSVLFDDGNIFSAKDVIAEPILTIATPVGLQLGQSPAAISVTGQGHDLSVDDPLFSPVIRGENRGLSVRAVKTLALVGGGLVFNGGTVSAPGGRIELGSVEAGVVRLNSIQQGWDLSYEDITAFQNIQLRSQALGDASGTPFIPGGSIQVQGKQLSLDSGSLLLVQNLAEQPAGAIDVSTSESVNVSGTDPSGIIRSRITNETVGVGQGGDVNVKTNRVIVEGGAAISTQTYSQNAIGMGRGGDVKIEAAESIRVEGSDAFIPSVTSSIAAASFGTGDSGNNTISTKSLETLAGGTVLSTTLGAGNGGEVNITAEDIIAVGIQPDIFAPSGLSATTLNAGNAGSLTIDTSTVTVLDGARIDSSAGAAGEAGSVTINASESVKIAGGVAGSVNPSIITSSANVLDPALQALLNLPASPSGNSGNLTINTPRLEVTEGALATVRNDGTGNAGNLTIKADLIKLDRQGTISADTQSGEGGNIIVDAESFILQGQGATSSTAAGNGNGGNLTINTDNH